jgi:hypothetical protein
LELGENQTKPNQTNKDKQIITTTTKKQGHESKMGTNREENSKGGEERMG